MTRHFLSLFVLIVATLVGASWAQDELIDSAERGRPSTEKYPAERAVLALASTRLHSVKPTERPAVLKQFATDSKVDLELFDLHDIAGMNVVQRLEKGDLAVMTSDDKTWLMQKLSDSPHVLAFKYTAADQRRSALEWLLVFLFYAAIALVVMGWLWPLRRDLDLLERATASFGDRNWSFDNRIGPGSQVHALAQSFQRMAARIDGLITSHKDMSNAMSHEIKTPLARMRFEIEMARTAASSAKLNEHLDNLNRDVSELNAFVTATLDYAILERAEVALSVAKHDFTQILPAIALSVRRGARSDVGITYTIDPTATGVECDVHLLETVIRNLLHNAVRYARSTVRLSFEIGGTDNVVLVEDDGPGIPTEDRKRVFESFVQLDRQSGARTGYGLGLAIVRRAIEWHGGTTHVGESELGGARFEARWPIRLPSSS